MELLLDAHFKTCVNNLFSFIFPVWKPSNAQQADTKVSARNRCSRSTENPKRQEVLREESLIDTLCYDTLDSG